MTNDEYRKKYPIGTKIRYIGSSFTRSSGSSGYDATGDVGKTGKVVGYWKGYPLIFLPESTHISEFSTYQVPVTWETGWDSLEILLQKNQQLLFDFAYEI